MGQEDSEVNFTRTQQFSGTEVSSVTKQVPLRDTSIPQTRVHQELNRPIRQHNVPMQISGGQGLSIEQQDNKDTSYVSKAPNSIVISEVSSDIHNESLPQWQLHDNYKVKQELCIGPLGIYKNKALDNEP